MEAGGMPLGGSTILSPQAMNSAPEKGLLGMGKQTQATKGCVYGPPCSNAVLPLPKTPPPAGQVGIPVVVSQMLILQSCAAWANSLCTVQFWGPPYSRPGAH